MKEPTSSVSNREARLRLDNPLKSPLKREKKIRPPRRDKHLLQTPPHSLGPPRMEVTPWLQLVSDRAYTSADQRLHDEIVAYVAYMQPTPEEKAARENVFRLIQQIACSVIHRSRVELFGSSHNGLCLPTSDIDIAIITPPTTDINVHKVQKSLGQVASRIRDRAVSSNIVIIKHARVPIISLITRKIYGSYKVDIGINNTDGVTANPVIKKYLDTMPALLPLVLVVKGFLFQRSLNDASKGGLSSYTILCLCIRFLELNPSNRPPEFIDRPMETESLGSLLADFFFHYGITFQDNKLEVKCLVNPDRDIGKSARCISAIRNAFKDGYSSLLQLTLIDRNALGSIISIPHELVSHRAYIADMVKTGRMGSQPVPNLKAASPRKPRPRPRQPPTAPRSMLLERLKEES